jgi:hypothetical protein
MNKTGKAAFASFLSKTDRLISPGTIAKVIEAVVQRLPFPRMNFFQLSEDLFAEIVFAEWNFFNLATGWPKPGSRCSVVAALAPRRDCRRLLKQSELYPQAKYRAG